LPENATGIGGGTGEGGGGGTCGGQLIWFTDQLQRDFRGIKPQICRPLCDPNPILKSHSWIKSRV